MFEDLFVFFEMFDDEPFEDLGVHAAERILVFVFFEVVFDNLSEAFSDIRVLRVDQSGYVDVVHFLVFTGGAVDHIGRLEFEHHPLFLGE